MLIYYRFGYEYHNRRYTVDYFSECGSLLWSELLGGNRLKQVVIEERLPAMIKGDLHKKCGRQKGTTLCPFYCPDYRNNVLHPVHLFLWLRSPTANYIPEAL